MCRFMVTACPGEEIDDKVRYHQANRLYKDEGLTKIRARKARRNDPNLIGDYDNPEPARRNRRHKEFVSTRKKTGIKWRPREEGEVSAQQQRGQQGRNQQSQMVVGQGVPPSPSNAQPQPQASQQRRGTFIRALPANLTLNDLHLENYARMDQAEFGDLLRRDNFAHTDWPITGIIDFGRSIQRMQVTPPSVTATSPGQPRQHRQSQNVRQRKSVQRKQSQNASQGRSVQRRQSQSQTVATNTPDNYNDLFADVPLPVFGDNTPQLTQNVGSPFNMSQYQWTSDNSGSENQYGQKPFFMSPSPTP